MDRLKELLSPGVLGCAFFAVLFLQSGIDKVTDRAGNLAWMEPHFANSPFKGKVPMLLSLLALLELATGALAALTVALAVLGSGSLARYALGLAALTLLALFTGQRLAKDYAGAASLAAYFAVVLVALATAF